MPARHLRRLVGKKDYRPESSLLGFCTFFRVMQLVHDVGSSTGKAIHYAMHALRGSAWCLGPLLRQEVGCICLSLVDCIDGELASKRDFFPSSLNVARLRWSVRKSGGLYSRNGMTNGLPA